MKESFVPMKKKIEVATPKIVSGEANIAGEVYDVSEQEDIVGAKKNKEEKLGKKTDKEDKLKKLTDEEYGELQASFIDRLPSSEAGAVKKKKIVIEEKDGYDKIQNESKKVTEIETWETLKRKRYSDTPGKVVREREKKTMGRVFGEPKVSDVLAANEVHKDRAAAGGRTFGEKKDSTVPGQAEAPEKAEARLEQEKQLELLQALVAEKRKAYATEDYKKTNLFTKIKGILKLGDKAIPFNAKDSLAYQQYQKALNDLRDLEISMLKNKYADTDSLPEEERKKKMVEMKKEMGELAVFFGADDKLEVMRARSDARLESMRETKTGAAAEIALNASEKALSWYRNLKRWQRVTISVALFSAGGAAAYFGAAGVVPIIVGSKLVIRALGSAATVVGATGYFEGRAEIKSKEKATKESGAIFSKEGESVQAKFEALSQYCGKAIDATEETIRKEKWGSFRRKLYGVGAGAAVFFGTAAVAEAAKNGFDFASHTEFAEKLKSSAMSYIYEQTGMNPDGSVPGGASGHPAMQGPTVEAANAQAGAKMHIDPNPDHSGPMNEPRASGRVGGGANVDPNPDHSGPMNEPKTPGKVGGGATNIETDPKNMPDPRGENKTPFETKSNVPGSLAGNSVEASASAPTHEIFNSGVGSRGIEGEFIKKMQELGISEDKAGKYAHRMVERFIDENKNKPDFKGLSRGDILGKLSRVGLGEKISFNIDPNNLDNSNIINFRGFSGPHSDVLHPGGSPINPNISPAMTEQMNQEEISRSYNNKIMGEHAMNRPVGNVSPGNLESIESDFADGAKGVENSAADFDQVEGKINDVYSPQENDVAAFSNLESHPELVDTLGKGVSPAGIESIESDFADGAKGVENSAADFDQVEGKINDVYSPQENDVAAFSNLESHPELVDTLGKGSSPGNLESIESDLADGAKGAENDVAKFSELESQTDNAQGVEIPPMEKKNIEEIAGMFDNRLGILGENRLAEQIIEARNLTGDDFHEAYLKIFSNIANNIFDDQAEESLEMFRDLNAEEYLKNGPESNPKITEMIKYNQDHFGGDVTVAKDGESMRSWIYRMIDKMLESGGIGFNKDKT